MLEIKGENRFKPWRQDVEIEPGNIRKIHAVLIPVVGGQAVAASGSGSKGSSPPAAPVTPPPAPVEPPSGTQAQAQGKAGSSPSGPAPGTSGSAGAGLVPAVVPPAPPKRKRRELAEDSGGEPSDELGGGKEPARAAEAECSITINSVPWSELWIDGKSTSRHTPVVDHKVPCGKHKLAFKRPEMQIDQTENINVRPGQPLKKVYTLAVDE